MSRQSRLFVALLLTLFFTGVLLKSSAQQVDDPNFDTRVAKPAYADKYPKVLFDEAHFNFHTTTGRYKPFASLITNDGYRVTANKEKFSAATLKGYDILVISNALGAERQNSPGADQPAFTEEECDAVREFVRAGGSLLLIADHAPFGSAAETLAKRFNVEMSKGFTIDQTNYDQSEGNKNISFLLFSRENKLLADHPITLGRNASERLSKVVTFTGQSLKGPEGSIAFLKLSDQAIDRERQNRNRTPGTPETSQSNAALPTGTQVGASIPATKAAGRAQGLALTFGKGRVVVLGEAALLSAQLVKGQVAQMMGSEEVRIGMNRAGNDDRQLALNIMHWLSRLLN
ncbi:MAG TPA: hypothetical protein VGC66_02320 [Pyrinomonadaceae bacterium]|jgi:hypothetical protein